MAIDCLIKSKYYEKRSPGVYEANFFGKDLKGWLCSLKMGIVFHNLGLNYIVKSGKIITKNRIL